LTQIALLCILAPSPWYQPENSAGWLRITDGSYQKICADDIPDVSLQILSYRSFHPWTRQYKAFFQELDLDAISEAADIILKTLTEFHDCENKMPDLIKSSLRIS
jgi:hypothetical protein